MQDEEFLELISTVEEILELKEIPELKCVPLVAIRLRRRVATWWQQTKLTRA